MNATSQSSTRPEPKFTISQVTPPWIVTCIMKSQNRFKIRNAFLDDRLRFVNHELFAPRVENTDVEKNGKDSDIETLDLARSRFAYYRPSF